MLFGVTDPPSMNIDMGVEQSQPIKTMGTDFRNECWMVLKYKIMVFTWFYYTYFIEVIMIHYGNSYESSQQTGMTNGLRALPNSQEFPRFELQAHTDT